MCVWEDIMQRISQHDSNGLEVPLDFWIIFCVSTAFFFPLCPNQSSMTQPALHRIGGQVSLVAPIKID